MSTDLRSDTVVSAAVVRTGSIALVAAGLVGAAAGLFLAYVPTDISTDRFSYPLDGTGYVAIQVLFFFHHLALAWGIYAVLRSGLAGSDRLAKLGGVASIATMVALAIQELVAIAAVDAAYPSPLADTIGGIYGVISLANGVALIVFGIAALRNGRWPGSGRWLLLILGVYVIVPLTPAIFGPFVVARLTITGWMLLFALLGWSLRARAPRS